MPAELFVLGDDMLVDINKEWISTIPELNKILRRDRGSEGDHDGRKKLYARKEFTYIYHTCDYKSPYENFSESERIKGAIKDAELPEDFTPDKYLQAAIDRYQSIKDNESIRVVRTLKQSLVVTRRVADTLINRMEQLLSEGTEEQEMDEEQAIMLSNELISSFSKISSFLTDLPKRIKAMDQLENDIKDQLANQEALRADNLKGIEED